MGPLLSSPPGTFESPNFSIRIKIRSLQLAERCGLNLSGPTRALSWAPPPPGAPSPASKLGTHLMGVPQHFQGGRVPLTGQCCQHPGTHPQRRKDN